MAKLRQTKYSSKIYKKLRKLPYICKIHSSYILKNRLSTHFKQNIILIKPFIMKSTYTLDTTDLRILSALQNNSRLTVKELASAIHLSPTPTFERVKRLERDGYITKYMAVLNAEKLECGFIAFCYLKLKQHTRENAMRIMEAVQNIPEIAECYNISGDYDFLLKIYTRDMKSYQKFLLRILGDLDCIGSLNSTFVLGEVKNTHLLPLPEQ